MEQGRRRGTPEPFPKHVVCKPDTLQLGDRAWRGDGAHPYQGVSNLRGTCGLLGIFLTEDILSEALCLSLGVHPLHVQWFSS